MLVRFSVNAIETNIITDVSSVTFEAYLSQFVAGTPN